MVMDQETDKHFCKLKLDDIKVINDLKEAMMNEEMQFSVQSLFMRLHIGQELYFDWVLGRSQNLTKLSL
jgi:hypothetical protein